MDYCWIEMQQIAFDIIEYLNIAFSTSGFHKNINEWKNLEKNVMNLRVHAECIGYSVWIYRVQVEY